MQLSEPPSPSLPALGRAGIPRQGEEGAGRGCRFVQLPAGASRKHLRSQPYGNDPPGRLVRPARSAAAANHNPRTETGEEERGEVTRTRPNTHRDCWWHTAQGSPGQRMELPGIERQQQRRP